MENRHGSGAAWGRTRTGGATAKLHFNLRKPKERESLNYGEHRNIGWGELERESEENLYCLFTSPK